MCCRLLFELKTLLAAWKATASGCLSSDLGQYSSHQTAIRYGLAFVWPFMLLFQLQVREELVVSSTGFVPTAEGFLNGFGVRSPGPKHLFASIVSVQG